MDPDHELARTGLNPVTKLVSLVVLSATVLLVSDPLYIITFACVVAGANLWLGTKGMFRRGVAMFALAIIIAQLLFDRSGEMLASFWIIEITEGGVVSGVSIAAKFVSLVMMSWLFVATTAPSALSSALTVSGMPYRWAFLPALAMRFVPVFSFELATVREAQATRGLVLEKDLKGIVRAARYTMMPLMFLAMSKVNALAASMTGRGFGAAPKRTMLRPVGYSALDAAAAGSLVAFVLLSAMYAGDITPLLF